MRAYAPTVPPKFRHSSVNLMESSLEKLLWRCSPSTLIGPNRPMMRYIALHRPPQIRLDQQIIQRIFLLLSLSTNRPTRTSRQIYRCSLRPRGC